MESSNQMFRIDSDTQTYPNAFTSDNMEEDENPRLDRTQEKTVVVPRIQSMQNYILKHHKHRLTRAHREKQLKMSCQALHNAPPNRT